MTLEQLAEIRARAEKATLGPWIVELDGAEMPRHGGTSGRIVSEFYAANGADSATTDLVASYDHAAEDASFIASARSDIPELCDALEEAWRERDELKAQLKAVRGFEIAAEERKSVSEVLADRLVFVEKERDELRRKRDEATTRRMFWQQMCEEREAALRARERDLTAARAEAETLRRQVTDLREAADDCDRDWTALERDLATARQRAEAAEQALIGRFSDGEALVFRAERDAALARAEKAEKISNLSVAKIDAELDRLNQGAERNAWEALQRAQQAEKERDAAQARVRELEGALRRATWQTLLPTRALGCIACRSFDADRHNEGCYAGAALAAKEGT